jgi:hypothetical protein
LFGLLLRAEKDERMRLQDDQSSFDEVSVLKMKIFYCLASFSVRRRTEDEGFDE